MHKMNRSLVAVVSWYNFKLIWLHRFLVIKTLKRKIKLTLTGEVEKQGTPAVATLHIITTNNKLDLYYLQLVFRGQLLQKTNDITSVQNIFYYLYTSSSCVDTGVYGEKKKTLLLLYTKNMRNVDGSLRIGIVHEDSWKKKSQHLSFYMLNNREHRRQCIIYPHQKIQNMIKF